MHYRVALLAASLFLIHCGPQDANRDDISDGQYDPNDVHLMAPATPTGTISGQVLDSRLAPLADVDVTLNVGGTQIKDRDGKDVPLATKTDTSGNFFFTGIPAGAGVLVQISKQGYSTFRQVTEIPSETGQYPLGNSNALVGPIVLTQQNGSLRFLITTATGRPAAGARAYIEATPAYGNLQNGGIYGSAAGGTYAEATADASGIVTFSNIPAPEELARLSAEGQYSVTVPAFDSTPNDGFVDSGGKVTSWTARSLVLDPSIRLITLPDARSGSGLNLLATNAPSVTGASRQPVDNMLKPGESLFFVFNQAVIASSVSVRVVDEYGRQSIAASVTVNSGNTSVTVTPATIAVGKEYNFQIHAVSQDNGTVYSGIGWFFGGDPATPMNPSSPSTLPAQVSRATYLDSTIPALQLNSGETVYIEFDQPVGPYGSSNPTVYAYINYDLNASGGIGDSYGELGYDGAGFNVYRAEPTNEKNTLFSLDTSNYTTRYYFTYSGPTLPSPAPPIMVGFARNLSSDRGLQTLWGQALLLNTDGITPAPVAP